MIGDLQGFVLIPPNWPITGAANPAAFWELTANGKKPLCRIEEVSRHKGHPVGLLILNPKGTALGMCDAPPLWFECNEMGNILMPPGMNEVEKMLYQGSVMGRVQKMPPDWLPTVRLVIISASLSMNKFMDGPYWHVGKGGRDA
jgi:hypothetical protein